MSQDSYRHQPLPTNRSIRVLHLQPASHRTAPIQCHLETISLDQPPKYWALSYSWDAQVPSEPISILSSYNNINHDSLNGVLKVTANCVAAMRQLRHTSETQAIWIDSICIDQTSLAERSSQVALMSEIYRRANQVVVWLGEGDAISTQAIQLLFNIGDLEPLRCTSPDVFDDALRVSNQQQEALLRDRARYLLRAAGCTSVDGDKLGAIFRRSWFNRMWTIQEVVFPDSCNIRFLCGDASIMWGRLHSAFYCLRAVHYEWGGWREALTVRMYLSQMMTVRRKPSLRRIAEGHLSAGAFDLSALTVMVQCRTKATSDPKDKVLALYGLLTELGVVLPRPDYTKSISNIYTETTAACIEHDKSLRILYYVPSHTRHPGLPSWVPDWSDEGWEEANGGNDYDAVRVPLSIRSFAATGDSDAKWKFSSDWRRLTVYGKIIDTVIDRTASCAFGSAFYRRLLDLALSSERTLTASDREQCLQSAYQAYRTLKEWVKMSNLVKTYPTGEAVKDVLRCTLFHGHPHMLPPQMIHQFGYWLSAMQASEEALTLNAWIQMPYISNIIDFLTTAMIMTNSRTLFRTSNGFLGTAPDRISGPIQNGDHIAVVEGLNMPIILRPDGNEGLRLVSHCYVHGIMYGEAWERVKGNLDEIILV